ncbi:MAG TPA: efflux RND transporter permease subunit [Candidatus Hydrogenedentes bacterium]|nr:efflux RND transporter permease subunit [Candidatus Hydrogenedentota bacterium]
MLARIFIARPRFAMVICIVLTLAGVVSMFALPIEQYPSVTPPEVNVRTRYPGASAEVLAATVAAPLEEEMNGVDNMIYMQSDCDNQGNYSLTVTFAVGTNLDMCLVKVQNRVSQALPRLPTEVSQQGMSVSSRSSSTLGIVIFFSPKGTHDRFFISDYVNSYVKDELMRIPGVGGATVMGSKFAMRAWLDVDRLNALGISTDEVVAAIRSQNVQASVGAVGAAPGNENHQLVYALQTMGRLNDPKDFENIIVRTNDAGGLVRLKDIGTVEKGADQYSAEGFYKEGESTGLLLNQMPGSNAITTMDALYARLEQLKASFPEDLDYRIPFDATTFVRISIKEIVTTLILTFGLVVFVCYIFLEDWRATLIPTLAIPVSLLSTFLILMAVGFTINLLTLFALVLAIGIVVDDAIIVVERVTYLMEEERLDHRAATYKAMEQISGAIIASTLVLLAIFVPVAFLGGITGQIYRQFAVAISTAIFFSGVVALTLSPALCSLILRIPKERRHGPLRWFNTLVKGSRMLYVTLSSWLCRRPAVAIVCLATVVGIAVLLFQVTPGAFIPDEDQGIIFAAVQLPEGATLGRTKTQIQEIMPAILETPGVRQLFGVAGFSMIGGRGENVGFLVVQLNPWDERKTADTRISAIAQKLRAYTATIPNAEINFFTPPAIMGLGRTGGIDVRVQALEDPDPQRLASVTKGFLASLSHAPEIMFAFTGYTANTPNLYVEVEREKAESLGVPVSSIFTTLQGYLGSRYVNDVNFGSRVNQVYIQAEWKDRKDAEDVRRLYVKSRRGEMVSMDSLVTLRTITAPRVTDRFNLFPSAAMTASTVPGVSSGAGIAALERVAAQTLPPGYGLAWSGMSYQEKETGSEGVVLIGLALVFGYLFLVAQYESWTIPVPVMLSLPTAMLGAMLGLNITGIALSIYSQLGLIMLVGIASKNAILIVEFARDTHEGQGESIVDSATTAMYQRFRPVLMTAFTTFLGTLPMVLATGAGSGARRSIGTTLFSGMSMATILGILFIPALYVIFQTLREKLKHMLHISSEPRSEEHQEEVS